MKTDHKDTPKPSGASTFFAIQKTVAFNFNDSGNPFIAGQTGKMQEPTRNLLFPFPLGSKDIKLATGGHSGKMFEED